MRFLAGALTLAALAAAAHAAPKAASSIVGFRIGNIGERGVDIVLRIPKAAAGTCAGTFRGDVSFFNASPGIAIAGKVSAAPAGCELPAFVPWTAVTADAVRGARTDVLVVRFRGELAQGRKPRKVDLLGALPREAIEHAEPMAVTLRRFARATDLRPAALGMGTTTVNAEVVVRSPLKFHVRVMQVEWQLELEGETVATGTQGPFIVFSGRPNPVTFPVQLHHRAALSAAGGGLARGARTEGRLTGVARLRFPGGDVDFPVEIPVRVALR